MKINAANFTARSFPIKEKIHASWSIAAGRDGIIYISADYEDSTGTAKLFRYDPGKDRMTLVFDVGVLSGDRPESGRIPQAKIHRALCVGHDGRIYAATHCTAPPAGPYPAAIFQNLYDLRQGFWGSFLFVHDPIREDTRCLGLIAPREGVRAMGMDRDREVLIGITYPRCHIVVHHLRTGVTQDKGRISQWTPEWFLMDEEGHRAFFSGDRGRLFRYDINRDRLEELSIMMPCSPRRKGRENHLYTSCRYSGDGFYYGTVEPGGHLFRFDPNDGPEGRMEDLGPIVGEDPPDYFLCGYEDLEMIRGMKKGRASQPPYTEGIIEGIDGLLYLAVGTIVPAPPGYKASTNVGVTELVAYNPRTGFRIRAGQMVRAGIPESAGLSALGKDGTIYWCQCTGDARLLMLHPPYLVEGDPLPPVALESEPIKETKKPEVLVKGDGEHRYDVLMLVDPVVAEGTAVPRELRLDEEGWEIPFGQCSITALAILDGKVYGGTGGEAGHLFVYDPAEERLSNLGPLPGNRSVVSLFGAEDNSLLVVADDRLLVFDGKFRELSILTAEEKVMATAYDSQRKILCGIGSESKNLFWYDVDRKGLHILGQISEGEVGSSLACDGAGIFYGSCIDGKVFMFDPGRGKVEVFSDRLPGEKGRSHLACVQSFTAEREGVIFGGTTDGYLFRLDVRNQKVTGLGRPTAQWGIPALTYVPDGAVYGFSGQAGGPGHVFRYDPETGELKDLGMLLQWSLPKFWGLHEANCMVSDHDGTLYLGERGNIAHLFVYRRS